MSNKEAKARVKINKLLEESGWLFFDEGNKTANIKLELNTKISKQDIDCFGKDFETTKNGFVDFLLLDSKGFPLVVLEAKRADVNPLDAKEQARSYAHSLNVRFIILSNGDIHYFWDLESGNPEVIVEFPSQESLEERLSFKPKRQNFSDIKVSEDFIALTQNSNFAKDPLYQDESSRAQYLYDNNIRILRPYQVRAIKALQSSALAGNDRFLFEMATGTGKTLVSAAVIKLFLRSGNAKRVLFLVDRIELERQASDNFKKYLSNDYLTYIYKEHRDDWRTAEIVVTTIQSLTNQDKYKSLFSPTDFDLLIADESHRAIGGNSRAVFEYFIGYKLGLTATPKDYLKNVDLNKLAYDDPKAWEKRQLLDTYTTFGCKTGEPTFKYGLLEGVADNYLINPLVLDARTEITTQILSDNGYAVLQENEDGEEEEKTYFSRDYEKKLFSEKTNIVFCKAFLENAMRDEISGEIGKSIIFCVSQNHAGKIAHILNQLADKLFPGKYNSDFALQITSLIPNAQTYTTNFSNNNLNGYTNFLSGYKSSKTRICVTVGMMTTGYDCQDILNIGLMRPIFSPTDFIQIKGRGTRKYEFKYTDEKGGKLSYQKSNFKLFDFFANCEYFEEKFDYDQVLVIPSTNETKASQSESDQHKALETTIDDPDYIKRMTLITVGTEGMKVDRKFFENAQDKITSDKEIQEAVKEENWDKASQITKEKYENKPDLYLTLDKLRKLEGLDRRLTWREVIQRFFGFIKKFKNSDELMDDEFNKFVSIYKPESKYVPYIRNFMKAYIGDADFRNELDNKRLPPTYGGFTREEYKALGKEYREILPNYIKDYVRLNTFMK